MIEAQSRSSPRTYPRERYPQRYYEPPVRPKKRHTLRNVLIVLVILGVLGAIIGGTQSRGGESTATAPALVGTTQSTIPHVAQWVTVATLSGSAEKAGAVFALTGQPARLSYTVTGGEFVLCAIYLMAEGTNLESGGGFPELMVDESGQDSTMLYRDAGRYYLDVTSNDCDWTVTIEEER